MLIADPEDPSVWQSLEGLAKDSNASMVEGVHGLYEYTQQNN